jgi:hypothetical protein
LTLLARVAFVLLVAATLAAFVVTQHLKRTPPVLLHASARPAFISPNSDGVQDSTRIGFATKRRDEAVVSVVDESGDAVRLLGRRLARPHELVRLRWDGRLDGGDPAPDGRYKVRVDLRSEGRTITIPGAIVVDRAAPAVGLARVRPRPSGGGPVVLPAPGSRGVSVRLRGYVSRAPVLLVYRTDRARPQIVARRPGRPGGGGLTWEGEVQGRPAPPGTYTLAVRVRDLAGNVATLPSHVPPTRAAAVRGLGVTVRYAAIRLPRAPAISGSTLSFVVDARRRRYGWAVRGAGDSRTLAAGASSSTTLRVHLGRRRAPAGVYELTVRAPAQRATVPFALTGPRRERVLLVLPALSWLGRDEADDDGNGFPDTLAAGDAVPLSRLFSAPPAGFGHDELPLLALARRARLRLDVTTDLALASGTGPPLAGHRGVVIAGSPEWEPPPVGRELRDYVRRGGRAFVLGAGVLRRTVEIRGSRLEHPSPAAQRDVFGLALGPLVRRTSALMPDPVSGTAAVLGGISPADLGRFDAYEELLAAGRGARVLGAAEVRAGRPVLTALRVGRGLVLRTGVAGWSARIGRERAVAATTRRLWALLAR